MVAFRARRARPANRFRRQRLQAMLGICEQVRMGLRDAGIDPAQAQCLRRRAAWAAELAVLGPVPDLSLLDDAVDDAVADFAVAEKADAKIQALIQYFRHRPAIDFADSSLAELYAWCIAQQGPQPGDPL